MKKLTLFLFICAALNAFAQKKSFFGINAGINIANQRYHITQSNSQVSLFNQNSVNPTYGVFYQLGVTEKTGLRLNAQYMGLGYKQPGTTVTTKISTNYFTIPLTFHYYTNQHLSFNAGPYLSFMISQKVNNTTTTTYHKNDFGFTFGGEQDIYKNFAIGVSYIYGLKNIWLNDTYIVNGSTQHQKVTNRALQITLIYKFRKSS